MQLGQITVRRLVQWTGACGAERLRVNDEYPRADSSWTIADKGRFLLDVLQGTDTSVLVVNVSEDRSHIVDGASRIRMLVDFQQGKLPMVVKFSEMPDRVSCRPHGVAHAVPIEEFQRGAFDDGHDPLVEAYYAGLQPDQQRAFLEAKLDVRELCNMSLEQEKLLYWQTNYVCPPSPTAAGNYDEEQEYADVAANIDEVLLPRVAHILHLIGGQHRKLACAEFLRFVRDMSRTADAGDDAGNPVDSA